MVNHVTFPSTGNTYSDGSTDEGTGVKYLANGGARSNFIPCFSDFITEANARIAATGLSLNGTSTDNLTIANSGSISFNPGSGKGFAVGTRIRLAVTASPTTNYMEGVITAYNQTTGAAAATLDNSAGSGTYNAWTVNVTGNKGSTGAPGTNGTNGSIANMIPVSRGSNTMLATGDSGKMIIATASFTQTFDTNSNLGSGWWVFYKNSSSGQVILNTAIDNFSSFTLLPGASIVIECDGTSLRCAAYGPANPYLTEIATITFIAQNFI